MQGETVGYHAVTGDFVETLYASEVSLAELFDHLGLAFSPVPLVGDVADPGICNLPSLSPTITLTATYAAAGSQVTDTYSGITLWDLLSNAGSATVTSSKNDILSKYVVATGSTSS
jgi:hypothetical protein